MLDIWKGVTSLLDVYAKADIQDLVVILYTPDAMQSAVWVSAALEQRNIPYRRTWMLPLQDKGFEERLEQIIPSIESLNGRIILMSFEQDTMSHTSAFIRVMQNYPKEKIVALRAISAGPDFFSTALLPTPSDLESRNTYLLERLSQAKSLRITTPSGSDFFVELESNKHRWISNRGRIKPGGIIILPAGEVATFPVSVDGSFIADFAYNINTITKDDVRLSHAPVHLNIKLGKVVDFYSEDHNIMTFLHRTLNSDCSIRVGELGFGTNFSVINAIAMNSHVNERCPGVHLGLGQHNQDPGVVDYQCAIHLDLIAKGGQVWADGEFVADLANIPASQNPHPNFSIDEDVFSPETSGDCCGMMQCDSLPQLNENNAQ